IIVKGELGLLRAAVSYPDIYEIGMSNLSVRLIYRLLNGLEGVSCERVFAPALDFETELRAHDVPLYSLETATPLRNFDLIGFSLGYELTFTNVLNILDLGHVSLHCRDREMDEPIVVAGGPAVTNPVPFGAFIDAVFIGEIEGEGVELFARLAALKKQGADRQDLLEHLYSQPYIWTADKQETTRRVLWQGFGDRYPDPKGMLPFPVPNIRTIQDHGVVEIMRGCPNGCRFCHAGMFYRPFRLKEPEEILAETEAQIYGCGYREITLSSLSTGDYPGIADLVRSLTTQFTADKVSFSLPSLRINSLTLDLLAEISSVRKSGLTFAIETPLEQWQRGINKTASLERTVEILLEAKRRGWKLAKFYFMVGLPVSEGNDETGPILDFLNEVKNKTGLGMNVNVSCFIPKPHTPFQWARQLSEQEALDRIMTIKRNLSGRGIRVRYNSPFLSVLEGMVSRGDERAGEIMLQAFREGARFDSWEELVQWPLWRRLFDQADWDVEGESCRARDSGEPLPWRSVKLGVSNKYLEEENAKALAGVLTEPCCIDCAHLCGVCSKELQPRELPSASTAISKLDKRARERGPEKSVVESPAQESRRILFAFRKTGKAVFLGHLDVAQIFERAFLRAGYKVEFTQGFNPKPRLEFAQPISLGLESEREIAMVEVLDWDGGESFRRRTSDVLPEGIQVIQAKALQPYRVGEKKHSLMSLYWGSEFSIEADQPELMDRLAEQISSYSDELSAVVDRFSRQGGSVDIVIRQPEKGSGNVLNLIKRMGFSDPLKQGFRIVRKRQFAHNGDVPSQLTDYFESSVLI
ncbi:MAG TPA: TIGR03936 family radical SAM-associated protein, partial [Spirochaetia bacterium]|nr:TIGR03936 family radical SAM-associated protein [Spirochaetia bacterium]